MVVTEDDDEDYKTIKEPLFNELTDNYLFSEASNHSNNLSSKFQDKNHSTENNYLSQDDQLSDFENTSDIQVDMMENFNKDIISYKENKHLDGSNLNFDGKEIDEADMELNSIYLDVQNIDGNIDKQAGRSTTYLFSENEALKDTVYVADTDGEDSEEDISSKVMKDDTLDIKHTTTNYALIVRARSSTVS